MFPLSSAFFLWTGEKKEIHCEDQNNLDIKSLFRLSAEATGSFLPYQVFLHPVPSATTCTARQLPFQVKY